LTKKTSRV